MRHKVPWGKNITLPPHTQVWVKVVARISGLTYTKPKYSRRSRSVNRIHKVAANKSLEILLATFSTIEIKISNGMIISYDTRSAAIHSAVSGTMVAGICESLNLTLDQATAAPIRQPRTKVTDLSFAAPDEKTTSFTPTNKEKLYRGPSRPNSALLQDSRTLQPATSGPRPCRCKIGNWLWTSRWDRIRC